MSFARTVSSINVIHFIWHISFKQSSCGLIASSTLYNFFLGGIEPKLISVPINFLNSTCGIFISTFDLSCISFNLWFFNSVALTLSKSPAIGKLLHRIQHPTNIRNPFVLTIALAFVSFVRENKSGSPTKAVHLPRMGIQPTIIIRVVLPCFD